MPEYGWIQPTKCRVLNCSINSHDLKMLLRQTTVYETVCKPYITVTLVFADSTNIIDSLDLKGGEQCTLQFDSPPNQTVYKAEVYLHSVTGEQSTENLKTMIYTFNLIGTEFFKDRGALTSTTHQNQTGTAAIQQIWSKYIGSPLQILEQSIGMLAKDNPWVAHNQKPLTAIEQIRKTLIFGGSKTGNTLLFHDAKGVKLASLERLLQMADSGGIKFIQSDTWGKDFRDPMLYHAIMEARAEVDPKLKSGRFGTQETSAAANQGQTVFDINTGVTVLNKAAMAAIGDINSVFATVMGGLGGSLNVQVTDSSRHEKANAPHTRTIPEKAFSAKVKDKPQLTVKVPLQSGIDVTVGKGVEFELAPPVGDNTGPSALWNPMSGNYLVCHLSHILKNDMQMENGTTTMQCIKAA